jgi:hypothetical protein
MPGKPAPLLPHLPAATRAGRSTGGAVAEADAATPALRREAEALLRKVLDCRRRAGADFFELGRALLELRDRKLFLALGHPTLTDLLEQRRIVSPSLATRLIAIVRTIPKETALQLGPERTFEWLLTLRTQAGPEADDDAVRELAEGEPLLAGRPVTELSKREIAELRRRMLERREAGRADPAAGAAHRLARALAQRLQRLGAADAEVSARYGRAGWRLRLDLALPAAEALLRALD